MLLTKRQQRQMAQHINCCAWQTDPRGQRVQRYGHHPTYAAVTDSSQANDEFPDWLLPLVRKVGVLMDHEGRPPNCCTIEDFVPEQDTAPRSDFRPLYHGPVACVVTLLSDTSMHFTSPIDPKSPSVVSSRQYVPHGSALLLRGVACREWIMSCTPAQQEQEDEEEQEHEYERRRHIRLTFRHVLVTKVPPPPSPPPTPRTSTPPPPPAEQVVTSPPRRPLPSPPPAMVSVFGPPTKDMTNFRRTIRTVMRRM